MRAPARTFSNRSSGGAGAASAARARRLWTAALLLAAALPFGCRGSPPVVQPIAYNHKVHVDNGLACPACHASVENAAAAGVPAREVCMACHQSAMSASPEEEKVRQFAAAEKEIPWQRIYRVPDHVYFSHRRHVAVAGIDCAHCHGAVASLTAPPAVALVNHSMSWCIDCHASRGATQDCIHCHR